MQSRNHQWMCAALLALGGCFGSSNDGGAGQGAAGSAGDGSAGAAGSGSGGDGAAGDGNLVGNAGRGGNGAGTGGAGVGGGGANAAECGGIDRGGSWLAVSDAGAPPDLSESSWLDAIAWWTGDRALFLYKGYSMDGLATLDGASFDAQANAWAPVSTTGAPEAPQRFQWTGAKVIAWSPAGGTGGFYDPAKNAWTSATLTDAPDVGGQWNGSRMLVTENGSVSSADDFRMAKVYDFDAGTWTRIAGDGASPRSSYGTAWVGDQLVVWGGWANGLGESIGDGAVFDLASAKSSPTSAKGAPSPRYEPTVIAAGDRVIVWGGAMIDAGGKPQMLSDGGIYDPAKDTWEAMSTTDAPAGRTKAVAVWTGTRLVVTGGHILDPKMPGGYGPDMDNGGIFDPEANAWTPLAKSPSTLPGQPPVGPWSRILVTRNHEVVFLDEPLTAVQVLDAEANAWDTIPLDDSLKDRIGYWAFWTGCDLVVWGGKRVTDSYDCADAPPDQPVCDPWVNYESLPDGRMFAPK